MEGTKNTRTVLGTMEQLTCEGKGIVDLLECPYGPYLFSDPVVFPRFRVSLGNLVNGKFKEF